MLPALATAAALAAKWDHPGDLEAKFHKYDTKDNKGHYYGWRCGNPETLFDGNDAVTDISDQHAIPKNRVNLDRLVDHNEGAFERIDSPPPTASPWAANNDAAPYFPYVNRKAGIVFFKEQSLDHLRNPATSDRTFNDLFCGSYIARYKNPEDPTNPGVCVRDVDNAWQAILDADREVQETHALFKTQWGYQRTAPKQKTPPTPDYSAIWGSGREGTSPANWCDHYMREMLCHVAFPQFAGLARTNVTATNKGFGAYVRPVGREKCLSMMDNCNRHEPKPYENANVTWLEDIPLIKHQQDMDNSLYCDSWNRGFHIAKAGTGVAAGENEDEEEFVAVWDSSSTLTPIGFVAIAATLMALLQ